MRHLETADAFIRQIVKRRLLKLRKIPGGENAADILTKHVNKEVLAKHWPATGWTQHEESTATIAHLERMNKLCDLLPTDAIVKAHAEMQRKQIIDCGVSMAKGMISEVRSGSSTCLTSES